MMIVYTIKDKVPENAVFLPAEQQKHGDMYIGSLNGVSYLNREKRGVTVKSQENICAN